MIEIEEMIADAKAEEEVKKDNEFRTQLRNGLKDALGESTKVNINLSEYVQLKQKELDLDRILNALIDNVELNYSDDGLRLRDYDTLITVFRVLYPDVYDHLLAVELEHKEALANEVN